MKYLQEINKPLLKKYYDAMVNEVKHKWENECVVREKDKTGKYLVAMFGVYNNQFEMFCDWTHNVPPVWLFSDKIIICNASENTPLEQYTIDDNTSDAELIDLKNSFIKEFPVNFVAFEVVWKWVELNQMRNEGRLN
jgi:hypothetical protein